MNISGNEAIFVCFDCLQKARSVIFEDHQDFFCEFKKILIQYYRPKVLKATSDFS